MLNISRKSVKDKINLDRYTVLKEVEAKSLSSILIKVIALIFIIAIIALFLPWTQNIRAKGYVSTLNPYDKPQAIQSLIDGRIVKWYVREGQEVSAGDTIMQIAESKEDYLDPDLLNRTQNQITAKNKSKDAYEQKAQNLEKQYQAVLKNKEVKFSQNQIKIEQVKIKISSDSLKLKAAEIKLVNAKEQLSRTQSLYEKGIKSLTELESKNYAYEESQANVLAIENQLNVYRNEIENLRINKVAILNEFDDKLNKIQSDKMSSVSSQFTTEANVNKLESQYNKYKVRAANYYVRSPIDGIVTKSMQNGIGEFLKAGEDIVSVFPSNYEVSVEMYVLPRDMPLLKIGQEVRIQFDGWPAIVFSGWPENSYGTFKGRIAAIDNYISKNGKYRILIGEDDKNDPWPDEVRIGGGANALILLNEVRVYYELWRQLNGFPADYYENGETNMPKLKRPIKKFK